MPHAIVDPSTGEDAFLAGLRARRPEAVAELSRRLRAALGRALRHRHDVGDADVDDFAQDACVAVLHALPAFRGDSTVMTWAVAIGVRVAFARLRRRRAAGVVRFDAAGIDAARPELSSERAGEVDPARGSSRDELFDHLRTAIASELTDRQRDAVVAFLNGSPQVAIAERMSVSAGAFHKLMHDARRKLRAALEARGFDRSGVMTVLDE